MKSEEKTQSDNPYEVFSATNDNGDNLRKFSDELLNKFKGKILELYIGDQCETLNFEEYSVPKNCSIFGKLIDVLDRYLILECYYIDSRSKGLRSDLTVYINTFQIRAMTELDGKGSLDDIFTSATDADRIRRLLLAK